MFLDRATELKIAGNRPLRSRNIKVSAKKDGTITAWQSTSWATGGMGGGGMPPLPYVFTEIPNKRLNHTAVAINAGGARAWRAPNHPQASFLTCSALEDLAAKLRMDPLELLHQEPRLHRARGHLQSPIAKRRGDHGVAEALASARRRVTGPDQARPRPRSQHLGRRRTRQPVPHHHQP